MQPTMKLRLVRARFIYKNDPTIQNAHGESFVLQQWWGNIYPPGPDDIEGEWRDIEIAEE